MNNLNEIKIVTTDEGPFVADVFWVLNDNNSGCIIPQGSEGEEQLLESLQKLSNFNY